VAFTGLRTIHDTGYSKYRGDFRGWSRFNVDESLKKTRLVHALRHDAYPDHQSLYASRDELNR